MELSDQAVVTASPHNPAPVWGVYAVICNSTGDVWVGHSLQLDTQHSRLWSSLTLETCKCRELQSLWNTHGQAAFRFEELDRLRSDFPEPDRLSELRQRQALWTARLQGAAI